MHRFHRYSFDGTTIGPFAGIFDGFRAYDDSLDSPEVGASFGLGPEKLQAVESGDE